MRRVLGTRNSPEIAIDAGCPHIPENQALSDLARLCSFDAPVDLTVAGKQVVFRCVGGGDRSIELQNACARRSISPTVPHS